MSALAFPHAMIDVLAGDTASDPGARHAFEARVRAAQAGDVAAFEAIYRENVGRVYALCLRLTANRAEAEHLTQDTFVRAWEHLATFRGESAFATWLRHVAVSLVLGSRRENARRTRRVMTTDDETILASACNERRDDDGLDLERAIETLPEGARTVFVLHDIEGYKHDEIAVLAGIAEGTSKAQLHRARTLLKEVLR